MLLFGQSLHYHKRIVNRIIFQSVYSAKQHEHLIEIYYLFVSENLCKG